MACRRARAIHRNDRQLAHWHSVDHSSDIARSLVDNAFRTTTSMRPKDARGCRLDFTNRPTCSCRALRRDLYDIRGEEITFCVGEGHATPEEFVARGEAWVLISTKLLRTATQLLR